MKSENTKFKLIFSLRPGLGREGFKKNGKINQITGKNDPVQIISEKV